jgi:hypothetical protein
MKDPTKKFGGMSNLCASLNMELFYASIFLTVGNGKNTLFWEAPWLYTLNPQEITPLIFS